MVSEKLLEDVAHAGWVFGEYNIPLDRADKFIGKIEDLLLAYSEHIDGDPHHAIAPGPESHQDLVNSFMGGYHFVR